MKRNSHCSSNPGPAPSRGGRLASSPCLTRTTGLWTAAAVFLALTLVGGRSVSAHIVPAEKLHPVANSYRHMTFLLNLNPIPWDLVKQDVESIAQALTPLSPKSAQLYRDEASRQISDLAGDEPPDLVRRRQAARAVFEMSSQVVAQMVELHLTAAERALSDQGRASRQLEQGRQIWASFEHEVGATDGPAFLHLGECWLELVGALGHKGVAGVGARPPQPQVFHREAAEIVEYLRLNYGSEGTGAVAKADAWPLLPLPRNSPTFDAEEPVPFRLPPGSNINKQLPRPRQVLNMAERGVDEGETALIALGDMAFDSPYIFGEPARSLNISCNTCHNKSITNPQFFIPGLSTRPGGIDVSNSFFAPHANNGHLDALDIPDLRGIRFTAPYGRNGRFSSLRDFVRNVIVHEFNGPEPDPLLVDGLIAYMNEFDFLPNPYLKADGSLNDGASDAAKRGEAIFHQPFPQLRNRSCATCHIPSNGFLDHQRHDIGTVVGTGSHSRDRALDTPTLLSSLTTAPYFHDGSQPTLQAVAEWFNRSFELGLEAGQIADLTAYLETVGDGVDAYEDTPFTLDAELEEFSFFLSTYPYLRRVSKPHLIGLTLQTVGAEIRAHKWDLRHPEYMPALERMERLIDEAYAAHLKGDRSRLEAKLAEYRQIYQTNVDFLE